MTKYERTGETTDDPAVAVGWGLWRSSGGNMYRVASGPEPTIQYQPASGGHWSTATGLGRTPYHRMREAVEPKRGAELRRWMVAHPGVEVRSRMEHGVLVRFSEAECSFERWARGSWTPSVYHDDGYTPADGKGWNR